MCSPDFFVVLLTQETARQLEEATGGIVIWRAGAKLLVYRDDDGKQLSDEQQSQPTPEEQLETDAEKQNAAS